MDKLEQFIHKHTFTASRTINKDEFGEVGKATKEDLAQTLADFVAAREIRTDLDGQAMTMSLKFIVVSPDELRTLVEGLAKDNPKQGELYVGHDAQAG